MIGDWRKLRNEELHSLLSSPEVTRIIKSERIELVGHAAHLERMLPNLKGTAKMVGG